MYPVAAEKSAPTRKKRERPTRCDQVSAGSKNNRKNTTTEKTPTVRNWRAR